MEITNDQFFKVRYDTELDRLVIKKEGSVHRLLNIIKRHKFMTSVIITFMIFSTLNIFMIYSFMKILQNV